MLKLVLLNDRAADFVEADLLSLNEVQSLHPCMDPFVDRERLTHEDVFAFVNNTSCQVVKPLLGSLKRSSSLNVLFHHKVHQAAFLIRIEFTEPRHI